MEAFKGLLKFEHKKLFVSNVVFLLSALFAIWIGPIIIFELGSISTIDEESLSILRYILLVLFIFCLLAIVCIQTIYSLVSAVKNKDIWLHNSMSMKSLVGVKLVYGTIQLFIGFACMYVTVFFINYIQGSFIEYASTFIHVFYVLLTGYIILMIHVLVIYTLAMNLRKWIGIGSYFITFIIVSVYLNFVPRITISQVQYGQINLPTFRTEDSILGVFSFSNRPTYLLEEIALWILVSFIFIQACKWLERVLTR